jgi:carbonic anhydrase
MKKLFSITLFTTVSLFASAHSTAHWNYDGAEGPEHWGELSEKYTMCKQGKNQSPINLTDLTEAEMEPLKLQYRALSQDFINNGHTIQVNFGEGSILTIDNKEFELKQFHFHTPSENQIDGKNYPMEAHLVHANKDGSLAVISVMFKEGKSNPYFQKLVEKLPKKAEDNNDMKEEKLNAYDMLPKNKDYYRFNGSLTTPPCSEGVRWVVMKTPVEMSKEELESFSKILKNNNRPVQPTNARKILK